jgi:hypothetical protein
MSTSDRILRARNALALFESLLLEAYTTATSETISQAIANHMSASAELRTSISRLHSLATIYEAPSRRTPPAHRAR